MEESIFFFFITSSQDWQDRHRVVYVCLSLTQRQMKGGRAALSFHCIIETELLFFFVTSQRGVSPIMHSWCGSLYLSVTLWHDCDKRLSVTTKSNIEKKIVCTVLVIFVFKLGKCFSARPLLFLIFCQVFWWFYFWLKSIVLLEHHSILRLPPYALILSIKHFQKKEKKMKNTINKAKEEFNSCCMNSGL